MFRQRFVLDTSSLTDSYMREIEGYSTLCECMNGVLDIIAKARLHLDISCYIPYPSVYNELRDFIKNNDCDEEILAKVDTWLVKKTPDRYEVKIPSKVFYEYVDYMRSKINKGMNVAEEAIWEAATECLFRTTKAQSKRDIEKDIEREVIGRIISKFRDKYRNALRYGILDGGPDIDVLLLAKELDAAVVASDFGVQKWAEELGVRFMEAKLFPRMIKEYLKLLKINQL